MNDDPFGICMQENCNDNEPPKELPSLKQMAKNLLGTAADVAKGVVHGEGLLVFQEVYDERIKTCEGCEFFRKEDRRCSQCGCFMEAKARLKKAYCPVHKWEMVE